jgi:frataxin-like iron-binding protein CyaY
MLMNYLNSNVTKNFARRNMNIYISNLYPYSKTIYKSISKVEKGPAFQNTKTANERLNSRAKNYGASTEQVQNYEKHIFGKKKFDADENVGKDLEGLFDSIESTNGQFLKKKELDAVEVIEISYSDFISQSDYIFSIMKNAFKELLDQDKNLSMEVDRNNLFIKINVKKVGTYIISKELESRLIAVTSPLTGLFKYKFDPVSRYWISTRDNHIMDELLMREFCQHSMGLLIFNY